MPWAGNTYTRSNGTYSGPSVWQSDEAASIGIEASRHDLNDTDLATGINTCLTKTGQNAATANLPMGGFIHTNVGAATARTNYARASQVQDNAFCWAGTSSGTANALVLTLTPALTAYAEGQCIGFIANADNTTSPTVNINGLGAESILGIDGTVLSPQAISGGGTYQILRSNIGWVLIAPTEGAWRNWSPTYTGSGLLQFNSVTTLYAKYKIANGTCTFGIDASGTTAGTTSAYIEVTIPPAVTPINTNEMVFPAWVKDSTVAVSFARLKAGDPTKMQVATLGGAGNWGLGAGREIHVSGSFEV